MEYYRYQIENSGIELETGKRADLEDAKEFRPQHILLATGAIPIEITFPVDNTPAKVLQAVEVLRKKMKLRSLENKGIELITRALVKRIEKDAVIFEDNDGNVCRHNPNVA